MENSEGHNNKSIEYKVLPTRNLSESALSLKRLPESPTDADNDLRIVGFKVQLDDDEVYTFTLDKTRSKSVDILSILTCSSDLKNNPTCLENKEIEICIKSKNDSFPAINEQLCLNKDYCEEDKLVKIATLNPGRDESHFIRHLKGSSTAPLKYSTENSTREVQIQEESTYAGIQTIDLEVSSSEKLKDTCNQSENSFSYKTHTEMIDSEKHETKEIFKNQAALRTKKEAAPVPSQTEAAAISSIENEYTSTHIQDAEKVSEKSLDIENVPRYSPMASKPEQVNAEENCRCSCGHKKQHDCIYNCCFHKDGGDIIPASILFGQNLLYLASTYNNLKCEYCQCRLNISCSENTNNCDEKLKSDVHRQYCCDCGRNASTSIIKAEKAGKPVSLKLKNFSSSAFKESVLQQSQIENFENSEQIKEKENTCIAVKADGLSRNEAEVEYPESMEIKQKNFNLLAPKETILCQESLEQIAKWNKNNFALKVSRPSEIETIRFLDTPDVMGHCLESCSLPQCVRPRIEINLIENVLNAKEYSENNVEEQMKSKLDSTTNKNDEEWKEKSRQTFVGRRENEAVGNTKLDLYYSRSEVCPCSMCHNKAETAQKIVKDTSSSSRMQKSGSSEIQSRSTSPKIVPENFNYIAKDGWKPYNQLTDGFLTQKIKETENSQFEKVSNEVNFESFTEKIDDACKLVNDHLLNLGPVDEDKVRKAAEILHKRWFQVVGNKYCDVIEVRNLIQYFKKFSNNLVKTLLHSVDNNDNNVLHFAFANNKFDLVDELLKSGYALDLLNKGNKFGNTPLMICAISHPNSFSDWAVVRKCFEFSDVNERSVKNGQTPLMNAASCGFQNMIDLLLEVGSNPNLKDKDGSTALMYAAEHGHVRCIKSLMKHKKCDPTIKDKDGETACSIALHNGHKKVVLLIHMKALEKRRLSQNLPPDERFIFTTINNAARREAITTVPVSDLSN